ncbi:hypothetical protein DFH06DRAFT_153358 [Mycena polygramma]|nr:hypothetical protein DFH06DRAFT_153358 [Mycena polygramma]
MTTTCRTRRFLTGPLVHDALDVSTRLCSGPPLRPRPAIPRACPLRAARSRLSATSGACASSSSFFSSPHQPILVLALAASTSPRSDGTTPVMRIRACALRAIRSRLCARCLRGVHSVGVATAPGLRTSAYSVLPSMYLHLQVYSYIRNF